jgi:hypothetical protein
MFERGDIVVRIVGFWALMVFCWTAWWLNFAGRIGGRPWLVAASLLFVWSFLVLRTARSLALLGWLSVLLMFLSAILLPRM